MKAAENCGAGPRRVGALQRLPMPGWIAAKLRDCRDREHELAEVRERATRNEQLAGLTLAHRKKLEMARALSCAPKALLLDEVIAGVNPVEAREMVALIRRIRDEKGISILMIEHVMAAVMSVCEHVVVLDAGKLIAAGAPKEVVQNAAVIEAYLGKKHA